MQRTFCFIVRAETAQEEQIVMSYVVQKSARIELLLINSSTQEEEIHVKPKRDSFQRIIKYIITKRVDIKDKDDKYRGCFTNPDNFSKSIKFYIRHEKKIEYATKQNIWASKVDIN